MNSFTSKLFLFLFLLAFAACNNVDLMQELTQHDANEIIVVLGRYGIPAKMRSVEKQQEVSWAIEVDSSDLEEARKILVDNRLPRKKEMGLEGICKDDVTIPTPKIERCRELLAIKGEVINSLQAIPGVVRADVVINIPEKEDFPKGDDPQKRPTASVVVEVGDIPPGQQIVTEGKIQQFVANAVQGMDMRDVAVIISLKNPPPLDPTEKAPDGTQPSSATPVAPAEAANLQSVGGLKMDAASADKFKVLAVLFVTVLILLAGGLIFLLLKMARLRQVESSPSNLPALTSQGNDENSESSSMENP